MRNVLIMILLILVSMSAFSQSGDVSGEAAYIFAYYPKENAKELFETGYKEHLEWHKEKQDPLVWYAWYVQSGNRLGMFIDGSFGISHSAFDNRVDPAGDGKDFAQTTAPFAESVFRQVYALDRSLSTAYLLEDHKPSGAIEVFHITVHPGKEMIFEKAMRTLKEAAVKQKAVPEYTLYKLLSGGEHAGYLMMVPRKSFASFDQQILSIADLSQQVLSGSKALEANNHISTSVRKIESESWSYRADMSVIPSGR
ncbi:hypothetical protein LVD17_12625 [Fulvivirga ulvae]|uniref:hypothetical protein n=1 Tax=Fulvivirga ulvae TaxID=2904245 RepID=UPI001F24751C|nr:hypothetical protein [Fulvivirga ulvae]UII34653.1 hypothetical protein LVD17_12625 [Fulvivirga ulvae]